MAFVLINPKNIAPVLTVMFVLASFLWFRRTVVEFGWGSVRGQLTAILGFSFIVQAVGCALIGVEERVYLPYTALLIFVVARALFLLASARYAFHFLRRGSFPPMGRLVGLYSLMAVLLVLIGLIPNVLGELFRFSPNSFLLITDVLLLLSVFHNLAMFWDTLIMKRWAFGAATALLLVVGDALFISGVWSQAAVWVWYMCAVLISLTGTIRT